MRRVSAREAHELMQSQGYVYLDVRTRPEFDEAHPEGALHVPWLVPGRDGMSSNPSFVPQVEAVLARDARIVVGCASGVRSLAAATALIESGFVEVCEQRAGMAGVRDPFGRVREKGWRDEGLPVSTAAAEG
jgi:rhodanese-related sulfurtransferase